MKTKMLTFMVVLSLSACTVHTGSVGGGTGVITNNQFAGTRFAIGAAKTTLFLGIGGFNKDALVLEARQSMILGADMQPGEVIGQTTVDFKRTYFFPIQTNKVTVSAEIIDFSEPAEEAEPATVDAGIMAPKQTTTTKAIKTYAFEEEVYYFRSDTNKWVKATVVELIGERYKVRYEKKPGLFKQKVVPAHHLRKVTDLDF